MSTPVIDLQGVSKRFGDVVALADVSFQIPAGEVVALLGANGAGKTTAVSIMVGLRRPTSGQVRIFGLDPRHKSVRERRGVMLQDCDPIDHLTVREAVQLFRSYYPTGPSPDEVLELVGLTDIARKPADALSHGQKQRLFLAQSMVGDPALLFLDEPSAGMDVATRRGFHGYLSDLRARGRTILLATHDMDEADALADRVIVLQRGRVIQQGSPKELKRAVGSGRRWVRFHVAPGSLLALEGLPGVVTVSRENEQVGLLTSTPAELVSELVRRGVGLDELVVEGPSLEDAFLAAGEGHP